MVFLNRFQRASSLSTRADAQSFDKIAERYERRDEATGGWVTDWLEGVLNGRHGESAIDLGCGTGHVAALLATRYAHVRGIDLSQPLIDVARQKFAAPNITFEQGDLAEVTGQYDLVVSIMVLHHVSDLRATLHQISKLVAPGGLAILVDGTGPSPSVRWKHNGWAFLTFLGDVRRAWRKLRAETDRGWFDHLRSDQFLSGPQFEAIYGNALPGATLETISSLHSAVWVAKVAVEVPDN